MQEVSDIITKDRSSLSFSPKDLDQIVREATPITTPIATPPPIGIMGATEKLAAKPIDKILGNMAEVKATVKRARRFSKGY